MKTTKILYFTMFLSLIATLVLSLLLTFAKNNELPLLKSTGMGLLGFSKESSDDYNGKQIVGKEDFFGNPYGFKVRNAEGYQVEDNSAKGFGIAVRLIYWFFCVSSIGVIMGALVAVLANRFESKNLIRCVLGEAVLSLFVVGIAIICVAVGSSSYGYQYSTQYYFLLAPLAVTFCAALFVNKKTDSDRRVCKSCGRKILKDMRICGYCGEKQDYQ